MMKKYKGFTLVELIIVMAILSILMAAIMQMFKPIRETYVDSTLYENQRTAQNGIIQYISESIRYSTDIGLYTNPSASSAVNDFAVAYCTANSIGASDQAAVTAYIQEHAEIIIIDNKNNFSFSDEDWNGRVIRRKLVETAPGSGAYKKITDSIYSETGGYGKGWRVAMGEAYYGDRNYTISLSDGLVIPGSNVTWQANDGIKITVASYSKAGKDNAGAVIEKGALVTTAGEVLCKNLYTGPHGVGNAGMFDITKCTNADSLPNFRTPTATGSVVYIVYLNEKVPV